MLDATKSADEAFRSLIDHRFGIEQPDLYRDYISPSKRRGLNVKLRGVPGILMYPRQPLTLTVAFADVLEELLRLLQCKCIRRSAHQPKLLTHTTLSTALHRPQLCQDSTIIDWGGFQRNTNLTVIRKELIANLWQCYEPSYEGVWIMFKPSGKMPFVPQFGQGPLPNYPSPRRVMRYQFAQDAYDEHLARALEAGNVITIVTRAAESIANSDTIWQALRGAPASASLRAILLDWNLSDGVERVLIQDNWASLTASNCARMSLFVHDAASLDAEIALIGDSELLVAPLKNTPLLFQQLRPGDPFFADRQSQVHEILQRASPRA